MHRPHTLIGWALGNAMNMGVTLACYAAICRETGRPFVFPGSPEQYEAVTDVTDARILASQLAWAATTPGGEESRRSTSSTATSSAGGGCGPSSRTRWRCRPAPYPGRPTPLEKQMADAAEIWPRIVAKHGLVDHPDWPPRLLVAHRRGSRPNAGDVHVDDQEPQLGFLDYQDTERSFTDLFAQLRQARIIP